ncbi:hypothetical protein FZEAL_5330 [Fusarium zealandicum]|uniref:Protein kinase domain-containing protein n=1 Tax=Fusarium zealandicum TaxID=1053134 RepID=A0A8H4UKB2_9HYPO|nr:hypothetical protein FZEAL_5330 [Fusarium zealandicum]
MTTSPVMVVNLKTKSGTDSQAFLKLYDRCFGTNLRILDGKYTACRAVDEDAFQSFLLQGKIGPFIRELEDKNRKSLLPLSACDFHDDSPDGMARYESALWYEANEHFNNETEAYTRLADLQGTSIPRMHAHVCLSLSGRNSDAPKNQLQPGTENYLDFKGVLMEVITGYNLWDLPTSCAAPADKGEWPGIIQQAVDTAHEINKRGLILKDSGPRNVVVDQSSQTPSLIDFAQCLFKDRLFELLEEMSSSEDDDNDNEDEWDAETEFWQRVRSLNALRRLVQL